MSETNGQPKFIGVRQLSIGSLKLPGDMTKRMGETHVKERAREISRYGLINNPSIRREGYELIAGADRIAAMMLLGWENAPCDVWDIDAHQAEVWRHLENSGRRHDRQEQEREATALLEALERQKELEGYATGPGRRPTAASEARKEAAEVTGLKEETLRKRVQRERKRRASSIPPEKPAADINTLEMDLSEEFLGHVASIQGHTRELAGYCTRMQTLMTAMEHQGLPIHPGRFQQLREMLTELGAAFRGFMPSALCPYCKGTDGIQEHCGLCQGTGWIQKSQEPGVPAKFWNTDLPIVMLNGKQRELSEFQQPGESEPSPEEEDLFS